MEVDNKYYVLPDLDKKIDEAVYDATNFFEKKCPYCDSLLFTGHIRNKIHIDHFIPIAKGGQHVPWNILPVCQKCNSKKNATNPNLFLSAELNEKCEKYLQYVRNNHVGQIQIDLEKYAQIKLLFNRVQSDSQTNNNLMELTKAVFQIVTDKPYEGVTEKRHAISILSNERQLISRYFSKGDNNSPRLTSSEIKSEIETITRRRVNVNTIGKELKKLGFEKKSTREPEGNTPKKWLIERINRTL